MLDSEFIQAWTATADKGGLASAKNEARLIQEVRQARKSSDTVIVHLHWGTELQKCPNQAQRGLAPKLVAAGRRRGRRRARAYPARRRLPRRTATSTTAWATSSSTTPARETGRTGVLTLTINGRKVLKDHWTPATIQGGMPVPMTGAAGPQAVADWKALRGCTGLAKPGLGRPGQNG